MKENRLMLEVRNLKTHFYTKAGIIHAVDGVSFSLGVAETLGIVGESGCGKSVTCLSIMRLIASPPGKFVTGEIFFEGENLLEKTKLEMCNIRGKCISMIFQEPMTSLNPVTTVGAQIIEPIMLHQEPNRTEAKTRVIDMLRKVGIPSPEKMAAEYPHRLSGGMRQRVMIAMALCCNPQLLIADEPTTALDVTIQAQILDLLKGLKNELGMAIILVTHDLGVVAELVEKVIVMYGGVIVEGCDTITIFRNPKHPYTIGLMESMMRLEEEKDRLSVIKGNVPNALDMPVGCRFQPRCPYAVEICTREEPRLTEVESNHLVRCWHHTAKN